MDDCIFCKIVSGDIPSHTVYEDEHFIAILDINPQEQGHTLLIPKKHNENIFDLDETDAASMMPIVKRIAISIDRSLHPAGMNIKQNNGKAAGQEVMHYHLHLIPRFTGQPDKHDLEEIAHMIGKQLQSA